MYLRIDENSLGTIIAKENEKEKKVILLTSYACHTHFLIFHDILFTREEERNMTYAIAWLFGVPIGLLLLVWFVLHMYL